MKNSLFLKLMKKKSEEIIKVNYANTKLFKRKNDLFEDLRTFAFNITKKYSTVDLEVISRNCEIVCEKDGRFYEALNMLVEIKIGEGDYFVRFKLDITPFKCCVDLESFNHGNFDVEKYFDEHKTQLNAALTYELKKMLKETFGKEYVKMYKNYRTKIFENDALVLSDKIIKEYQALENVCESDIDKLMRM